MAPTSQVALLVLEKRVEPATGDDNPDARVEGGDEERVMPAERMADTADARAVNLRQSLKQIDRAQVVPNALHGRAGVTVSIGVDLVVAVIRIIRGERHV